MDFKSIEERWQKAWKEAKIFEAEVANKEKFFITVPYPYLNGNLHAGHTRTFTIADAFARYMRMKGYNVLFPLGFHVTGTPIVGLAELIEKRDERTMDVYTRFHDVPLEDLLKLTTPEKIVEYFAKEALLALERIGFSVDWRRVFTTTDPCYQKFIEWQYWKLRGLGLVEKGSHPVRYCPNDQNPVEDHDILVGEDASIVEFTVIKFKLEDNDLIFPCATLRPETIFGVTNIWLKPSKYVIAEVNKEKWVLSKEAAEKLRYMEKDVKVISEVDAKEFFGKNVIVPLTGRGVPILPAEFVDLDNATGIVMSVPAHAPYDYVALKELKVDLSPVVIIRAEGFKEIPAKEAVEAFGIESQKDERLEEATKIVYKREYHTGIMLENTEEFAGMKVSEAKEKVHEKLVGLRLGDVFYEFSEKPVICRCGTKCVVKVVRDQWFIKYSKAEWKEKVLDYLENMTIIPDYYREEFRNKILWLKDKACARRKGLGTRIPWDNEWLIESLSDSTIYMAYYIIAKYINSGKIKLENLTKEFFDYVFLNGSLKAAKNSKLSEDLLIEIKKEFDYWYPVDLRSSGKDLVANHLLFYLFHHVAIFPEKYWPKAIAVNGYVSLEGQKMSKSKGPLLTMKKALELYGADVTRLYILHAAEYDSDADWRSKDVEGLDANLGRFYNLVREHYLKEPRDVTTLDKWLISRFNKAVKEVREAMDTLQTRKAVNFAFFEVMNLVRWYLRRGGKNLSLILDDWIKLLTPFAPHICEELWHMKHSTFVSLEKYPEFDAKKVDEVAERVEAYLARLLEDIKEVMKFVEKAKIVYIHPAEEWKFKALEIALEKGISEAMKWLAAQGIEKTEISNFAKKIKNAELIPNERRIIEENADFLERELQVKVSLDSSAMPVERKRAAMPGKPAIFVT